MGALFSFRLELTLFLSGRDDHRCGCAALEASAPKNKVEQMDFDALQEYNSPAVPSEMMEKLEAVDVETLTPIEALNFLYELKKTLKGSLNG